ncbi:CzcE family metal-binding protein [Cupriavidus necator]|uniref:CzcE family metal-binding protein n=1 Tax=Cupriavidus necator TaxID=106590 RepID=UPI00068EAF6B|nr:CzcE family metal-binding protein [Cupriavidus necator]
MILPHQERGRSHRGNATRIKTLVSLSLAGFSVFAFGSGPAVAAETQVTQQASPSARLFGEAVSSSEGARTVRINPQVKAVAVRSGETIRFDFGSTSAAWQFAARPGNTAVELGTLFPEIPEAKGVWAYQNGSSSFAGGR